MRYITHNGVTRSFTEWAQFFGITNQLFSSRVNRFGEEGAIAKGGERQHGGHNKKDDALHKLAAKIGVSIATLSVRIRKYGREEALKMPAILPERDKNGVSKHRRRKNTVQQKTQKIWTGPIVRRGYLTQRIKCYPGGPICRGKFCKECKDALKGVRI
jgi:hypothetical protein